MSSTRNQQKYDIELPSGTYIATVPFTLHRLSMSFNQYRAWQCNDDMVAINFTTSKALGNVKSLLHSAFNLQFVETKYSGRDNTISLYGKNIR